METIVWEIEFYDGRIFRVFCANRKEKEKIINSNREKVKESRVITVWVHTTKQYLEFLNNEIWATK